MSCSLIVKYKLFQLAELSIFKSVSVLIGFYGHDSRVITYSCAQAAELAFLRIESLSGVDQIYDNQPRLILSVP